MAKKGAVPFFPVVEALGVKPHNSKSPSKGRAGSPHSYMSPISRAIFVGITIPLGNLTKVSESEIS